MVKTKVQITDYNSDITPTWCPGCGNFVINSVLKQALAELNIPPYKATITFDIGCAGNGADKIVANNFKVLHGRAILPAIGIKYANPELTVIAEIGDGGMYWEGAAHWIAASQRNEDITVLVHNNQIYGLTTGQTSPTTEEGYATKTYPHGTVDEPINPIAVSISAGATFVARAWVGEPVHLKEVIKQAILHKGFAIVDILQTCVTWNHLNTLEYYKSKVYKLEDTDYKPNSKEKALIKSLEIDKLPIGVFYKENKPTIYQKYLKGKKSLVESVKPRSVKALFSDF